MHIFIARNNKTLNSIPIVDTISLEFEMCCYSKIKVITFVLLCSLTADTEVTGKEERRSRVNVSRKSEQSTIAVGRPRKRQMKQRQIEETTVEQSQQLTSPERNDHMTDQEYETDQDGESWSRLVF